MRHNRNFLSTVSDVSDTETTVENTYREYDKYFNDDVVADLPNDCTEYNDTITFAKNMVDTIKEESEGT